MVVKLINTDGMAFIGPGSEWFWTALSGLVLAVTFIAIYRQLSTARNANAFEQMNKITDEFLSERNLRYQLDALLALRDGTDPSDLPYASAGSVADFWEKVAALVRAGHIDPTLLYENLGHAIRSWWATLAPFQRRARIETDNPNGGEHFEWLADAMSEMDRKAGVILAFDEAYIAKSLEGRIRRVQDELRVAEELRAVIVRPMSPAAPPAPAAPLAEAAPAGPLA